MVVMQINDDPRNNLAERLAQISLICMLLIASVREVLYFFAPEAASLNPIDYVLFVVAMPYIGIVFRRSNQFTKRFSFALVASFVVFGVIAQLQLGNTFSFENMLKVLFPLLLVIVTAGYTLRLSPSQKRTIVFVIFVFIFAGELRIFGSQGAVTITEVRHSTAYLLIGVAIVIWVSNIRTSAKLILLPALLFPLAFINVATAAIALGVFFTLELAARLRLSSFSKTALVTVIVVLVVFTRVDLSTIKSNEFGLLGSGRVAAWQDGISSFLSHGIYDQLVGQGSGSSYQFWGVWWWAQKDIHSDFLRILIENGLVVFGVLVIGFVMMNTKLQRTFPVASSIFVSAAATSIISNGVLGRPYATILWVLALVVAGQKIQTESSESKSVEVSELPTLSRN